MSNILTIVQARMGSRRLPGKIMLPVCGKPLLLHMMERMARARLAGNIVVATTDLAEDTIIVRLCKKNGINVFCGNDADLLDRHFQAARLFGAQVVVKIPSDCPLIDHRVIDRTIRHWLAHPGYDYVSNLHPASYPDGNDVEVMSFRALEIAWRHAVAGLEREHTTPYLWENPDRFRIGNIQWERGLDYSMSHRWTIDYPEDYEFIKAVYERLYPSNHDFSLDDILDLMDDSGSALRSINAMYAGVNWYRHHLHELKTVGVLQTRIPGGVQI